VQQGEVLTWIGERISIEWIQKAMRLNPYHQTLWSHLGPLISSARRYSEASQGIPADQPRDHSHLSFLAACYAQLGDAVAAKAPPTKFFKRAQDFSIDRFIATQHYKHGNDREHHRAALVKAQLPGRDQETVDPLQRSCLFSMRRAFAHMSPVVAPLRHPMRRTMSQFRQSGKH